MEVHILDIIVYVLICCVAYLILPKQYKYEVGVIISFPCWVIFTFIYIIIFAIYDLNWFDIFININFKTEIKW